MMGGKDQNKTPPEKWAHWTFGLNFWMDLKRSTTFTSELQVSFCEFLNVEFCQKHFQKKRFTWLDVEALQTDLVTLNASQLDIICPL